MKLTCLVAVVTTLYTLTVAAPPPKPKPKPKIVPLEDVPHLKLTTIYFTPGISQELIELCARAAAEKGSEIAEYLGLPPDGHEMGFAAHLGTAGEGLMGLTLYNHGSNHDVLLVREGHTPADGNCTVLERFTIQSC